MIAMCAFVRRVSACVSVGLLSLVGVPVFAQTPAPGAAAQQPATGQQLDPQQVRQELDRLRQEFEAIRDSYGARLAALEAKLGGAATAAQAIGPVPALAEPAAAAQPPAAQAAVEVPSGAAGAGGPQGALPVYGGGNATSKVFNPDMAVIGNFLGAIGENKIESAPALEMHEAEVTFQAVVDPYARADVFLSASPGGLEIEEGFLTLTSLPGGLLAKVGKMKEQFGKVNTMHAHTLPWVDVPLVMKNFLGGEEGLNDSGISVSKLLLNPLFFLEATGEVYHGDSGPFQTHERNDVSWLGRLRGYRDITEGTNLDVGVSFTRGHNDAGLNSTTRLFGVDATVRYRPLRRAIYRRFMGRTELMWSHRGQETGDVSAFGMYVSGDYQFARRWFGGVRFDRSDRANDSSLVDKGPSLVVTYWPSEFSQIRGQYRRTTYAEGVTSNEALFQFLFSIGAHGAHVF
ncbi:MAG: TonB-dependent receptor [Acidobacteriota bacterium]|nr:TonB-dependent receptor [Acidobacteriota bacterium]